jgi:hypothetical protein
VAQEHLYRYALLDGPGGDRLRREPGRHVRQQERPLEPRHHRHRDGRGAAAPLRHAPHARALPYPQV